MDADSESLLERAEMVTDHFPLNLSEGSDAQEIFNHLDPSVVAELK